ncbi:hypothetical protein CQW23_04375 [Capsicum baccatum]|uniref:O-methyltransferase C-terminal domain-containing protein n=1 Tax=Capsicum baccatum TaxID=33114 RepID=A0A2G2XEK7_CAPBA|nr:hypothetical protein CQW23_04375 [Capsicum baccatum]
MTIENKSNACTTRIKLILQQTPSSLSLSGSKTILSPGVKNSLQVWFVYSVLFNSVTFLSYKKGKTVKRHLCLRKNDFLQHVMYNWSDEDCVSDKNEGRKGKVLIIDMVLNRDEDEANMTEVKLIFDILMTVYVTGRQRTEKEWEKLFLELRLAS